MFTRVFTMLFAAVLLYAVAPAQAHEHCELEHFHNSKSVVVISNVAQIPVAQADKARPINAERLANCAFLPNMPLNHCKMADCFIKCDQKSPSGAVQSSDGEEYVVPVGYSFNQNPPALASFGFTQETAVDIFQSPEPRPPLA
jgi:hypothetical protein